MGILGRVGYTTKALNKGAEVGGGPRSIFAYFNYFLAREEYQLPLTLFGMEKYCFLLNLSQFKMQKIHSISTLGTQT